MRKLKTSLLALGMAVTCLCSGVSAMDSEKSEMWTDAYATAIANGITPKWATVYATQYELQMELGKSHTWSSAYARAKANGQSDIVAKFLANVAVSYIHSIT